MSRNFKIVIHYKLYMYILFIYTDLININNKNVSLILYSYYIHFHMIQIIYIQYIIFIGHIQLAQVPDRHEPDTPGEIDYKYVLSLLETTGYTGYVGLEYRPKSLTVEGLNWIKRYGYTL